ncbi:hemin uptake protein HemP [Marivita hallyeonensis]|uniref:Hemin uptake protein HemP n=1 Tax=Marivita hallyeonensis TaxID=996342 RepID=A0A1M5LLH8_9RHOB|nr:hemin uptake protein HemP [Marivita hallyeonensis]SHG65898.1 Hemin uptake protein HemP [Marivita hallyeonensis]
MNAMNREQPIPAPQALHDDIPTYDARVLISNGAQAKIVLDGQVYTLRITRAGKLILTK